MNIKQKRNDLEETLTLYLQDLNTSHGSEYYIQEHEITRIVGKMGIAMEEALKEAMGAGIVSERTYIEKLLQESIKNRVINYEPLNAPEKLLSPTTKDST